MICPLANSACGFPGLFGQRGTEPYQERNRETNETEIHYQPLAGGPPAGRLENPGPQSLSIMARVQVFEFGPF